MLSTLVSATLRLWVLLSAIAAILLTTAGVASAGNRVHTNATDFAPPPVDDAFTNGLAVMKAASGFREVEATSVFPDWRTNLCLLLGFRVDNGAERFVRLVELTTLPPPPTNALGGAKASPGAKFEFTADASNYCPTSRVHRFTSPRYPVRVRVFSEQGRLLKESRETLAWQFLTNGLVGPCVTLKSLNDLTAAAHGANAGASADATPVGASTNAVNSLWLAGEEMTARSLAALVALFGDALTSDALKELRDHAVVVVRPPNLLKVIFSLGLNLSLEPHFDRAVFFPVPAESVNGTRVLFPADLWQGKRLLVTVEFVAGSTQGPHFLAAGVRAIRAVHPTKPERRLLAQVLAVGVVAAKPDFASQPLPR